MKWNPMVPELLVSNYRESLDFYVRTVGFSIVFERQNPNFAYLDLDGAQLMLEEDHLGSWSVAPTTNPRGRGMNLQIDVPDAAVVERRLMRAGIAPFRELTDSTYKTPEGDSRQLELLVQDPDGYLIRLVSYFD